MTKTDARHGDDWLINDEVCRLRQSGTERLVPIADGLVFGRNELDDPHELVSVKHAAIFREPGGHWAIKDVSRNGLRMDRTKRPKFPLIPGLEIGMGKIVVVAESPRSIALRAFLQRRSRSGRNPSSRGSSTSTVPMRHATSAAAFFPPITSGSGRTTRTSR